jgi:hypothetical protein
MLGLTIPEKFLERQVPKHLLNLEEVEFALGGEKRVKDLRAIKALVGKRDGQSLVFSAGHVAEVSARYMKGEYDQLLEGLRK